MNRTYVSGWYLLGNIDDFSQTGNDLKIGAVFHDHQTKVMDLNDFLNNDLIVDDIDLQACRESILDSYTYCIFLGQSLPGFNTPDIWFDENIKPYISDDEDEDDFNDDDDNDMPTTTPSQPKSIDVSHLFVKKTDVSALFKKKTNQTDVSSLFRRKATC